MMERIFILETISFRVIMPVIVAKVPYRQILFKIVKHIFSINFHYFYKEKNPKSVRVLMLKPISCTGLYVLVV